MSSAHSTPEDQTVYFIQFGKSGPIKIGFTNGDPRFRLQGIQTACPELLYLIAKIGGVSQKTEAAIHKQFKYLRVRGEWFAPSPDLMTFIAEYAEKIEPFLTVESKSKAPIKSIPAPKSGFGIEAYKKALTKRLRQGHLRRERSVGRPTTADDPEQRRTHIRCVSLVRLGVLSIKEAAAAHGITRRTFNRWERQVLGYPDPEAEGLRRHLGVTGQN